MGGGIYFFVIFVDPAQLILTPLFTNFLNFTRDYKEVLLNNILELPMLSKVNKVQR